MDKFYQFSEDFRMSMTWSLLGMGLYCLILSFFIIWEWRETKPRDEKFWFVTGIFLQWFASVNYRVLFLLKDAHYISPQNFDLAIGYNMIFSFVASIFWIRAMTQHRKKNLWKFAAALALLSTICIYFIRVM